jgi:hypothetical protein
MKKFAIRMDDKDAGTLIFSSLRNQQPDSIESAEQRDVARIKSKKNEAFMNQG